MTKSGDLYVYRKFTMDMLINVVNREDGQCTTIRFKRGKDCKDCAFEIKVDGVEKSGFINVRFDADGAPEISAYEKCGTTDCCAFRTSFDPDTGDSTFCDDAPWDCNYRLATGNMPQDLEEGQLVVRMVPLYIGLIFLFLFWPSISIWNMIQDNKYMQRLQANLEKRTSFGQNNPDAGHHGRTTGSRSGSRGGNRPIENV
ncbi:unnamed protein product [Amoebophrya sp. A120]|nr:unnamed protein product [Amoebophrya sp. A120]|eukprot:GSA120T00004714001.1